MLKNKIQRCGVIGVSPDSSMEGSVTTTGSTSQRCVHNWCSGSDVIQSKHNMEHVLTITWMLLQQSHAVNLSPPNPKNISGKPPRIQHEIYSTSDWLGASPENLWQIWTTSQKSSREGCEAPEPPLSRHLKHHVICWPEMGGDQQRVELRLFLPPAISLSSPSTMQGHSHLSNHPLCLLNQQTSAQYMAWYLGSSIKQSISYSETKGQFSAQPGTLYLDTTSMGIGVTVSCCPGVVRWQRSDKKGQYVFFFVLLRVPPSICNWLQLSQHDVIPSWYVTHIRLTLLILILFLGPSTVPFLSLRLSGLAPSGDGRIWSYGHKVELGRGRGEWARIQCQLICRIGWGQVNKAQG
jgi:hypothetical protein